MRLTDKYYREGLLIERISYVIRGDKARILLVDKELARLDGVLSTGSQAPLVEPVSIEKEDPEIVKPKRTSKKLKGD
jgi:hypothetical protein